MSQLGLVLSAGGARGAYESGVVYYIRKELPKDVATRAFEIQAGTSVGAINTAGLVAYSHDPKIQGEKLRDIWFSMDQDRVYKRDFSATRHFIGSTLGGILGNLFTFDPFNLANRIGSHFNSFLDTSPLKKFLQTEIPWDQLNKNVEKGPTDAIAINVTNLTNGQNELFVHKKSKVPYVGHYLVHNGPMKPEYALASSAIPIVFPTVKIGKTYYTDGGVRLYTPMSPAIQLGADRLIVIGLRKSNLAPGEAHPAQELREKRTPTISEQLGRILNGFFLDRVQFDIEQLERINTIIETSEKIYGENYLDQLNKKMKEAGHSADIAKRGLRKIDCLEIQPSEFITTVFLNWFKNLSKSKFKFSTLEKTLVRLLDIDPTTGSDLLSYITFAPEYIRSLFDLGYEDAKRQRNKLIEMMGE